MMSKRDEWMDGWRDLGGTNNGNMPVTEECQLSAPKIQINKLAHAGKHSYRYVYLSIYILHRYNFF